jgi:hypothetical protein
VIPDYRLLPLRPLLYFRPLRRRVTLGAALALALLLALVAPALQPAVAAVNLVQNSSLETLDGTGYPQCFEKSGWGTNTFTYSVVAGAHTGTKALQIGMTARTDGDRKAMMLESAACAPGVTVAHQYDVSVWYKSTTPNVSLTLFRFDTVSNSWQYWTDLTNPPVSAAWNKVTVRTPPVPANTSRVTWGLSVYGVGTLTTDDYEMYDVTVPDPEPTCTAGAACTKGSWTVNSMQSPVRSIHAVLMKNGNVLLIAGSGNDPNAFAAGTFTSAVYNVATGTFTNVATPADMFCSGHVQLSDGRILVMGGNKKYSTPTTDYQGLKTSYIFDPATNAYTRTNDMASGHWYPSATELGNGDVISLGGLGEDGAGTVATEYWNSAQNRWLGINEANQTWSFWGLYPAMILMQDGRLFYSGSHVFGNGLPGTGSSIYNYQANTITDVPGLQNKDARDQSMSVLLPPAQDQRVLTLGGGNINTNPDANRLTDIIDLKQGAPAQTPGPLIPTGTLTGGVPETGAQGKMYVSAVILPDGKVFETGGGLHNRADPVYEASMFNPQTNTFTANMATDPVPRTYHSSAFLLPDGRVMAVGNNPGDGSFDNRVSIYSPPYLYAGGTRPAITNVAQQNWAYGSSQTVTVNGAVTKASLIRPAAVTHSSDPNQRYVELPMSVNGNSLQLNLTSNPNLAPPGWYMLFVTNAAGVPSIAKWVHVG